MHWQEGVVHIFGSSGCNAAGSPFEEVGPAPVFEAAFDGEQGIGARLRLAPSGPLESAADDLLAGAFHDAGSDRQSEFPAAVAAHSVRVGLVGADAGGDGFGPVAVRLQSGDDTSDPPGVQLLLDPAHPQLLFAFVRRWLRRGVYDSIEDLKTAILDFIEQHNEKDAKPFKSTASLERLVAAAARARMRGDRRSRVFGNRPGTDPC